VSVGDADGIRHPRPVHLHWRYVGLVALGGVFGTATREALALTIPVNGVFPFAIFLVNIIGAFLLGVLLEGLTRRGPDAGRRRTLRLLLGTGFLGGFTTYSALAVDSALLLSSQAGTADGAQIGVGLGYAFGTVLAGALATWGGIAVGAVGSVRRSGPRA
jgi:fluoride exporter